MNQQAMMRLKKMQKQMMDAQKQLELNKQILLIASQDYQYWNERKEYFPRISFSRRSRKEGVQKGQRPRFR